MGLEMMKQITEYSREQLELALEKSVKLQSHYAYLLNMYDGGGRMTFESGKDWMSRLDDIGELEFFLNKTKKESEK